MSSGFACRRVAGVQQDREPMEPTAKGASNRASLPKVVKVSAEARATELLRQQIVEGLIPAGCRVTEAQFSAEMGLSRATIRTALHELQKEGLLKLTPYTGWTVIQLTRQDVWELYTLRSAVERLASQLVAGSTADDGRSQVDAAFRRLEAACTSASPSLIAEADFSFHAAIVDAAGHTRLREQYGMIAQQIRVYIRSSDALIADPLEILAQHRPIRDAIIGGDAMEAARLAEAHNLSEGEKLSSLTDC
ncbi:GntR family transcriptional regulator [Xanthobacteraceae bacterium A53D]